MSKEFSNTEISVEIVTNTVELPLTQLDDLSLALIGGGSGTVSL